MTEQTVRKSYVDYKYYQERFFGKEVDLIAFNRNLIWATALMDRITFGRLKDMENVPDCAKDALCAAVEKKAAFQKRQEREVTAENIDGYSVTYAKAGNSEDLSAAVIADMKIYLSGTGLLYRGRSRTYDSKSGHYGSKPADG